MRVRGVCVCVQAVVFERMRVKEPGSISVCVCVLRVCVCVCARARVCCVCVCMFVCVCMLCIDRREIVDEVLHAIVDVIVDVTQV